MHLYIHPSPGHLSCTCIYRAISICPHVHPLEPRPSTPSELQCTCTCTAGDDRTRTRGGEEGRRASRKEPVTRNYGIHFSLGDAPRDCSTHVRTTWSWPWLFSWWIRPISIFHGQNDRTSAEIYARPGRRHGRARRTGQVTRTCPRVSQCAPMNSRLLDRSDPLNHAGGRPAGGQCQMAVDRVAELGIRTQP